MRSKRPRTLVVTVRGRHLLHPQQQIHDYVQHLTDFSQLAQDGRLTVSGLAFLHNATAVEIQALRSARLDELAAYPLFSGDETGGLRQFVAERLSPKDAARAADDFLTARTRPSGQLLEHVSEQVTGHEAFTLLDEQRVAYEVVRSAVHESRRSNTKKVVLVTGGPDTGKSVIAVAILGDQAKRGFAVAHATGSRSFTTTLRERVGRRAGNLFRYFNNFTRVDTNDLDVLVCDEAHRIRETSNSRWTSQAQRSERSQVEELIAAARVPVFLLDQQQTVHPWSCPGLVDTMSHRCSFIAQAAHLSSSPSTKPEQLHP